MGPLRKYAWWKMSVLGTESIFTECMKKGCFLLYFAFISSVSSSTKWINNCTSLIGLLRELNEIYL